MQGDFFGADEVVSCGDVGGDGECAFAAVGVEDVLCRGLVCESLEVIFFV